MLSDDVIEYGACLVKNSLLIFKYTVKCSPLDVLIGRVDRPLNRLTIGDTETEVNIADVRERVVRNIEKSPTYEKWSSKLETGTSDRCE